MSTRTRGCGRGDAGAHPAGSARPQASAHHQQSERHAGQVGHAAHGEPLLAVEVVQAGRELEGLLTHHARAPLVMKGGTTFHFVTDGIQAALGQAREAARGKDVRLGGGVATVRQYLAAGLVDELHLAVAPALLGRGEHLFAGLDAASLGYRCTRHVATERAVHVVLTR